MNQEKKYRSKVTSKYRTTNLLNFIQMVGDSANQNTLYVSIGREKPWADNETDNSFAPPYPNDDYDGLVDFWSNMIGVSKVPRDMIDAVIPRKDWGDERYPNPRTFFIGDIVVVNNAPYNKTDYSKGWMIYRVVDIPDSGSCSIQSILDKEECYKIGGKWTSNVQSSEPPVGEGNGISMGDGYIWEYMYTIPPDVSINKCTNEYIVVPFPADLKQDPTRWGYNNVIKYNPDDYNLLNRLKAHTLRFKSFMDAMYFPKSVLFGNKGFRQIAIIQNPLLRKNKPSDPNVKATGSFYAVDKLEPHSGDEIYFENRTPITRSPDQTEEISIYFDF